ncbi:MAG: hypothetical protein AB7O32_16895 [Vicinamibacterales bacterium]
MSRRFAPLWLQFAALVAATPLFAQQAAVDAAPPAAAQSAPDASQRVGLDPDTGELRGLSQDEARALVDSLVGSINQSDAGLVPVQLPNGGRIVSLEGRFEAATLAKVGPDGTVVSECVTTRAEAERFLLGAPANTEATPLTAPAPVPLEEK